MSFILISKGVATTLFLLAVAIPVATFSNFVYKKEREKALSNLDAQNYVIKMPSKIFMFLNIGILLLIIMMAILLFAIIPKNESMAGLFWFTFVFVLCFSSMIFFGLRYRVVVAGEKIQYYPAFGKMREYTFSNITDVEDANGNIVVYSNGTVLFKFSIKYTNVAIFIKHLEDLKIPTFKFLKPPGESSR